MEVKRRSFQILGQSISNTESVFRVVKVEISVIATSASHRDEFPGGKYVRIEPWVRILFMPNLSL